MRISKNEKEMKKERREKGGGKGRERETLTNLHPVIITKLQTNSSTTLLGLVSSGGENMERKARGTAETRRCRVSQNI